MRLVLPVAAAVPGAGTPMLGLVSMDVLGSSVTAAPWWTWPSLPPALIQKGPDAPQTPGYAGCTLRAAWVLTTR